MFFSEFRAKCQCWDNLQGRFTEAVSISFIGDYPIFPHRVGTISRLNRGNLQGRFIPIIPLLSWNRNRIQRNIRRSFVGFPPSSKSTSYKKRLFLRQPDAVNTSLAQSRRGVSFVGNGAKVRNPRSWAMGCAAAETY